MPTQNIFPVLTEPVQVVVFFLLLAFTLFLWRRNKNLLSSFRDSKEKKIRVEQAYQVLHTSLRSLVLEIDSSGIIQKVLPSAYSHANYSADDLIRSPLPDILPLAKAQQFLKYIHQAIENSEQVTAELTIARWDTWFDCTISPLTDSSVLVIAREITEMKKKQARLNLRSHYDALTGLPNRALLFDRLEQAIRRIQRNNKYKFFFFFIDLDRFRNINETLGYAVGDSLLQFVAKSFHHQLRRVDTIARFGRDEFAILLDDVGHDRDAFRVIERIQTELARPVKIREYEIFISASIGVVRISPAYRNACQIIQDAETAMHQAKAARKGYRVFHPGMQQHTANLLEMETDLRNAIKNEAFMIHYQPIVDLENGSINGLEALVRWHHPSKGILAPAAFIPMAEETGLIIPIGNWVLRHACIQFSHFVKEFQMDKNFTLAVNLSPRQFNNEELVGTIRDILEETGMNPMCLKLEVTERVMMADPDVAFAIFRELKKLGIQLAVDDFGTGYSSLSYLHKYPFDTLKIDRSFVKRITAGRGKHCRIIQAILSLASHLKMNVVAEGIEDAGQLNRLQQMKCSSGQGFYFSKPLDSDNLKILFKKNKSGERLWLPTA